MATVTLNRPAALLRQWAGVLGSPLIWFIQMELSYALVPTTCANHSVVVQHVIFTVALALTAIAGFLSWQVYREAAGAERGTRTYRPEGRARFLGLVGTMVSGLMFILITAQWIPVFLIAPCTQLQR